MESRVPRPFDPMPYRWATALPIPPVVNLVATPQVTLTAMAYRHTLAAAAGGLPALVVDRWGYAACAPGMAPLPPVSPGPTLAACTGVPAAVTWGNMLAWRPGGGGERVPPRYPFRMAEAPVAAMMMMPRYYTGHTVVHLHGGHVPWQSDGYPMRLPTTATAAYANPGGHVAVCRPGQQIRVTYPNSQQAATLWYHDHLMDSTATNVYAGLAGAYLVCDPREATATSRVLNSPGIPLVLQDISLIVDPRDGEIRPYYGQIGTLDGYRAQRAQPGATRTGLSAWLNDPANAPAPEFKGSTMIVNAALCPTLDVPRGPVRLRMVNGCSGRILVMRLSREEPGDPAGALWQQAGSTRLDQDAITIWQIGGDGGFLERPVALTGLGSAGADALAFADSANFLILAPGERADIVMDFSQCAGNDRVFLTNHATENAPFGNGGDNAAQTWPATAVTTVSSVTTSASVTTTTAVTATKMGLEQILRFTVRSETATALDLPALCADLQALHKPRPKLPVPETPQGFQAGVDPKTLRALVVSEFDAYVTSQEILDRPHLSWPAWNGIGFLDRTTPATLPQAPAPDTKPGTVWSEDLTPIAPAALARLVPPSGGPLVRDEDCRVLRIGPNSDEQWEIWEIWNISRDIHPVHLHHTQFFVIDRWTIGNDLTVQSVKDHPLDPNECGWKDTVRSAAGELVRIAVRFDDGGDGAHDYTGNYVMHCHLLDHEDMGMMRPLRIDLAKT